MWSSDIFHYRLEKFQLILIRKKDPGYAYKKISVDFQTIFNKKNFFLKNHEKSKRNAKKYWPIIFCHF